MAASGDKHITETSLYGFQLKLIYPDGSDIVARMSVFTHHPNQHRLVCASNVIRDYNYDPHLDKDDEDLVFEMEDDD